MAGSERKPSCTKSNTQAIPSIAAIHTPRTEQRLALILAAVDEGYWDWNISTGEITYGEGWLASLGYSHTDISRDRSLWESVIHPDDLPAFDSNLQAHLTGER